jgi:imidazolonepropionase-like amidohydrolase
MSGIHVPALVNMGRTFLVGATLVDGINPVRKDMTVVVEGNRISAVGRGTAVPAPHDRDLIFNLAGMTFMPGLFQCHLHAAMDNIHSYHDLDMKYPATYLTLVAAKNLELMLNVGFTSAVGAGSPANIDVVLKHAIAAELVAGPRLYACSQHLVTTGESLDYMPSFWHSGLQSGFGRVCDGPEEFRKAVRAAIKDGADIVKIHATGGHGTTLSVDCLPITFEELRAACEAAHERGKKIRAHAASKAGILLCARAGVDLVDHVDFLDDECIELFVRNGTSITPGAFIVVRTLKMMEMHERRSEDEIDGTRSQSSPFFSSIAIDKGEYQRALDNFRGFLPKAMKAGVNIINGDDFAAPVAPHGTYADELVSYVEDIGIPAKDVITWATRNAARFVERTDLGVLAEGKIADLLIVKGNPVEDITLLQQRSNLVAVMKDGKFVHSRLEVLK